MFLEMWIKPVESEQCDLEEHDAMEMRWHSCQAEEPTANLISMSGSKNNVHKVFYWVNTTSWAFSLIIQYAFKNFLMSMPLVQKKKINSLVKHYWKTPKLWDSLWVSYCTDTSLSLQRAWSILSFDCTVWQSCENKLPHWARQYTEASWGGDHLGRRASQSCVNTTSSLTLS